MKIEYLPYLVIGVLLGMLFLQSRSLSTEKFHEVECRDCNYSFVFKSNNNLLELVEGRN